MNNNLIDKETGELIIDENFKSEIINIIKTEIADIMNDENRKYFYDGYNIDISEEQQFFKNNKRNPGTIYIVVKFSSGSIDFGQVNLPISIQAIAEQDKNEVCQTLLLEFCHKYNLKWDNDRTIRQAYQAPYVLSNFNEVFEGFRSLLYLNGVILLTSNSNYCTLYYEDKNGEEEEIDCLSFNSVCDITLDSQAFHNSNGFVKSVGKFGVRTFNITTYLLDTEFYNRCIDIYLENLSKEIGEPLGINTEFKLRIKFKNRETAESKVYKLANFSIQQQLRELTVVSLTFTN